MSRLPSRALPALAFALALAPLLVALFGVPVVPSHDGPRNLYASHVFAHASSPAFSPDFERSSPVTALGFALVYSVVESVLPWRVAYAITLLVGLLATPLGVWLLARSFDPRRAPVAIVALGACYQWTSHMGFINYAGSVGLGLVALGLGLGSRTWSVRRELSIYAAIWAAAVYHPFGGQFAAVGLFVHQVLHLERGFVVRRLGGLLVGTAPVVAVTLMAQANLEEHAARAGSAELVDLSWPQRLEGFGRWFLSGPSWRSAGVLACAGASALATLAGALGWAKGRLGRSPSARSSPESSSSPRRVLPLLAVVAVGALGVALLPMHSNHWQYFQPRFIPLVVLPWLPLLPLERLLDRRRALATVLFTGWAMASNGWVADHHLDLARVHEAAFSGLGRSNAEPGRTLLPIVARHEIDLSFQRRRDAPVPSVSYFSNLGLLYAIDREARSPYGFASLPNVHLVTTRPDVLRRTPLRDYGAAFAEGGDADHRRSELARLAAYSLGYDDVLFYGAAEDADAFLAHGFDVETRAGGFFVASFRGCPATILLSGPATSGAIHLAFPRATRIFSSLPLPAELPATVNVERTSCEGLRVLVEAKGPDGAPLQCVGASEREGDLAFVDAPGPAAVVRCELRALPR
jgi:hypothetical protein